jgi:hypothetical protein
LLDQRGRLRFFQRYQKLLRVSLRPRLCDGLCLRRQRRWRYLHRCCWLCWRQWHCGRCLRWRLQRRGLLDGRRRWRVVRLVLQTLTTAIRSGGLQRRLRLRLGSRPGRSEHWAGERRRGVVSLLMQLLLLLLLGADNLRQRQLGNRD